MFGGMDMDHDGFGLGGFGRPARSNVQKRQKVEKKQDPPINKDLKVSFFINFYYTSR